MEKMIPVKGEFVVGEHRFLLTPGIRVHCVECGDVVNHPYADLNGEPFKAYYDRKCVRKKMDAEVAA